MLPSYNRSKSRHPLHNCKAVPQPPPTSPMQGGSCTSPMLTIFQLPCLLFNRSRPFPPCRLPVVVQALWSPRTAVSQCCPAPPCWILSLPGSCAPCWVTLQSTVLWFSHWWGQMIRCVMGGVHGGASRDTELARQLRPLLGDTPANSAMMQPLVGADI